MLPETQVHVLLVSRSALDCADDEVTMTLTLDEREQILVDLILMRRAHASPFYTYIKFWCTNCGALSVFFTRHPLAYVTRAMEEFDATFFAGIQKSNYLDIHERHSV
jgi:hypothetical protein